MRSEAGRRFPWLAHAHFKNQPFSVKASVIVLLAILAMAPILVAQIWSEGQRTQAHHEFLDRLVETRGQLFRTFLGIQAAETAQRGYLLTGRQEFLKQYEQDIRQIQLQLQRLEHLTAGTSLDPPGRRLAELVRDKLAQLARALSGYGQDRLPGADDVVSASIDKRLMDEIRGTIEDMLLLQNREIARASAEVRAEAASSQRIALLLFGGIIAAVFLGGTVGLVEIVRRRKAETGLVEARQAADTARAEADLANKAKTEFLATMSHEIRTPLHAVIGNAELLLDGDGLHERQREHVERIQAAATALLNLVNDILDISKIEAGQLELAVAPFSVEAVVDNAISIVTNTARRKKLGLRVAFDTTVPVMLVGDAARLRQVLINLLGNALKFTEEGEVMLRVEHRGSTEAAEALRFWVIDTGPGIPEDKRERLFRRFSRIDLSTRQEGTGLGLSISKHLVEKMGGEIGFESDVGRGSTFWFSLTFPRVQDNEAPEPIAGLPQEQGSGRILVVDDLDQNRDLARKMLESAGYSVDEASDGRDAVAAIESGAYDLVLMDIQMPGMDGVTATRLVRGLDSPSNQVPIIAMTANVMSQDITSFKAAGMNDYLSKPFRRKELLRKVQTWIIPHSDTDSAPDTTMASSAPDRQSILDRESFDHALSLMGKEWVARSLSELDAKLTETFSGNSPNEIGRELLARQSHLLISRASMLGFTEIAEICSELEVVCKTGQPIASAFLAARQAALRAQAAASQLAKNFDKSSTGIHP